VLQYGGAGAGMARINVKRAYQLPSFEDGRRFLVDGLWPRGLKKADLNVEDWLKDVAPSEALRNWFKHDPRKWEEFKIRYYRELDCKPDSWRPLLKAAEEGVITLVFASKDERRNNAIALKAYLEARL